MSTLTLLRANRCVIALEVPECCWVWLGGPRIVSLSMQTYDPVVQVSLGMPPGFPENCLRNNKTPSNIPIILVWEVT